MKKLSLLVVLLIVLSISGVIMLRNDTSDLPQQITTQGLWECLPHKDTSGPQTEECAFGIAVDQSDRHYALDLQQIEDGVISFSTGTRIKVEGLMVPANQLSSDVWQKYPIDGIISVTSIEKI